MAGTHKALTPSRVREDKHTQRPGEPFMDRKPAVSALSNDDGSAGRRSKSKQVRSDADHDLAATGGLHKDDRPTSMVWIAAAAVAAFAALIIAGLMLR